MTTILDQKRINELSEVDLLALVEGRVSESRYIDYKSALPGPQERERLDFLRDVSSFANTLGGYLIYGMTEEGGTATGLSGLGTINPDKEILRMEEILRTGMRPRIHGVAFRPIALSSGGLALVVKIPRSWNGPHQVVYNTDYRFSARGQNGKYFMEVDELRTHLTGVETMLEKCRNHRLERVAKIAAGESMAKPIRKVGHVVIHYLPIAGFADGFRLSLETKGHQPPVPYPMQFQWGGFSNKFCFDGLHIYTRGSSNQPEDYCLVGWSGAIEVVHLYPWREPDPRDPWAECLIASTVETDVKATIEYILSVSADLQVDPPGIFALSLIGMNGWKFSAGRRFEEHRQIVDRDPFLVSEVFADFDGADVNAILKGLVDPLWNSGGWQESPNFKEGVWAAPRL